MARVTITYGSAADVFLTVEMAAKAASPEMLHDLKNRAVEAFRESLAEAGFADPVDMDDNVIEEILVALDDDGGDDDSR